MTSWSRSAILISDLLRAAGDGRPQVEVYSISPTHLLLGLEPPIPGYERFLGAHLFSGERRAIVDIGPTAALPDLLAGLGKLNVAPESIDFLILTHIHIDHAGATGTALRTMTRARVVVHERGRPHLIDPAKIREASLKTLGNLAVQYGPFEAVPSDRIVTAADGMELDLGGGVKLEVYLTPGHAAHHLSLFDRKNGVLLAGEIAGVSTNGRTRPATPPPFRLKDAIASLDRLIALNPSRLCYGHFGCYDGAVEKLVFMKNKMVEWHEIASQATKAGKSPEEMLAILREKDPTLDYLNALTKEEFDREHDLLMNTIIGLAGPVG